MIAGMDYSKGDIVICMDADLQHPPACIPKILRSFEEGFEIINVVPNRCRPNLDVFIFEATPELCAALDEHIRNKDNRRDKN